MEIGNRIAVLRKQKGFSQLRLAKPLGKTPQWLSQIELGHRSISVEDLGAVAKVLGVEPGIFFTSELNVASSSSQESA